MGKDYINRMIDLASLKYDPGEDHLKKMEEISR